MQAHDAELNRLHAVLADSETIGQEKARALSAALDRLRAELHQLRTAIQQPRQSREPRPAPVDQPDAMPEVSQAATESVAMLDSPADRDDEQRAANIYIASLERKLNQLRRVERELKSVLGGLGIGSWKRK